MGMELFNLANHRIRVRPLHIFCAMLLTSGMAGGLLDATDHITYALGYHLPVVFSLGVFHDGRNLHGLATVAALGCICGLIGTYLGRHIFKLVLKTGAVS